MKSRDSSTLINITTINETKTNEQTFKGPEHTLIECLLDVSENRLETYLQSNKKSFVSDMTANVLKVKKETTLLLNSLLNKIKT